MQVFLVTFKDKGSADPTDFEQEICSSKKAVKKLVDWRLSHKLAEYQVRVEEKEVFKG